MGGVLGLVFSQAGEGAAHADEHAGDGIRSPHRPLVVLYALVLSVATGLSFACSGAHGDARTSHRRFTRRGLSGAAGRLAETLDGAQYARDRAAGVSLMLLGAGSARGATQAINGRLSRHRTGWGLSG
jgi:hypothetical protein